MSTDTFIALCVAIIALCALSVSIWQCFETRKHNKLSVRPCLSLRVMISRQAPYMGIQIENNGIGPAVIKKCTVYVDKMPFTVDSYEDWVKAGTAARIFSKKISFLTLPEGTVIKEGQGVSLIAYPKENQTEEGIKNIEEVLAYHLRAKVTYESIYKEKFEVTNIER